MLISIDGIYGAGKSTLIRQLSSSFNLKIIPWNSCEEVHFYFSAMRKRGELNDPLVYYMMLLNDFAFTYERIVRPLIEQGIDIIMDRYFLSLIVRGEMRGLTPEFCKTALSFAKNPDISIVLDVSVNNAIARRGIPDQSVWKIGLKSCTDQYNSYSDYLAVMRAKYLWYAKETNSIVLNTDKLNCEDVFNYFSYLLKFQNSSR